MKRIIFCVVIAISIPALWFTFDRPAKNVGTLRVTCSPAFSKIVSIAGGEFENEFGIRIELVHRPGNEDMAVGLSSNCQTAKEIIPLSEDRNDTISVVILETSNQPASALKFARYLAAPEKGGVIFHRFKLNHVPGDTWTEKPNLTLYSGGVNRPAVEKLLTEFKKREGIELTTVYNGCGILCAAMQTMTDSTNPRFPDAYFACDLCFVPPVAEHFTEVVLLTETDIGIAVPKENPHNIKTLVDLAKPGLKVGLCNQKQSTLGYMTGGILKSSGLEKSIRKNMAVEVPTADFLITQMRSGALDAAIVYRVNAELQKEHIKFIKIKHEGARAIQPFAVRADSEKRQLATRLRDHFLAHPEAFEETGFTWRGNEGPMKSADIKIPEWLSGK